jgi:hypothetical protein
MSDEEIVASTENAKRQFALNTFNDSLKKRSGPALDRFRKVDPFGSGEYDFFKMPHTVNPFALVPPEVQDFDAYTSGYRISTPNLARSSSLSTITSDDDTTSQSSSTLISPPKSPTKVPIEDDSK